MSGSIITIAGALLLLATGCSTNRLTDPGPGKRVEATLREATYVAGQSIDIRIKNLSDLTLQYPYAFCKIELERQENAGWVTVASPDGCTYVLGYLGAGQIVAQAYRLPPVVPAGTYRLTMAMPWLAGETVEEPRLTSPSFQITAGN
jgi:hypothetical protein